MAVYFKKQWSDDSTAIVVYHPDLHGLLAHFTNANDLVEDGWKVHEDKPGEIEAVLNEQRCEYLSHLSKVHQQMSYKIDFIDFSKTRSND